MNLVCTCVRQQFKLTLLHQDIAKAADDDEATAVNIHEVLSDYDWKVSSEAAALEGRLYDELLALDAANIHALIQSEDQANAVITQVDRTIIELDEIDKWLTEYTDLLDVSVPRYCVGIDSDHFLLIENGTRCHRN